MPPNLASSAAAQDAADESGYTPLHLAALSGNLPLARMLLDLGAEPLKRDRVRDASPMHRRCNWALVR